MSLIKRLILYEFTQTLGPRFDRFSVRCPYYRESVSIVSIMIIEVFLTKMYKNFVGTLETVRKREVFVLEKCPYQEV